MAKPKKLLSAKIIRRIRKMIERVKANPELYDQELFPRNTPIGNECGAAFCAAGHLVWADPTFKKTLTGSATWHWTTAGMAALELKDSGVVPSKLFGSSSDWPTKFAMMYKTALMRKTARAQLLGKVRAFEARWENFIATDGRDSMYGAE